MYTITYKNTKWKNFQIWLQNASWCALKESHFPTMCLLRDDTSVKFTYYPITLEEVMQGNYQEKIAVTQIIATKNLEYGPIALPQTIICREETRSLCRSWCWLGCPFSAKFSFGCQWTSGITPLFYKRINQRPAKAPTRMMIKIRGIRIQATSFLIFRRLATFLFTPHSG